MEDRLPEMLAAAMVEAFGQEAKPRAMRAVEQALRLGDGDSAKLWLAAFDLIGEPQAERTPH